MVGDERRGTRLSRPERGARDRSIALACFFCSLGIVFGAVTTVCCFLSFSLPFPSEPAIASILCAVTPPPNSALIIRFCHCLRLGRLVARRSVSLSLSLSLSLSAAFRLSSFTPDSLSVVRLSFRRYNLKLRRGK